jgi:hypothetical protein
MDEKGVGTETCVTAKITKTLSENAVLFSELIGIESNLQTER